MISLEKTRNFCIIAHIDHGKSTLADRLLEVTGTIQKRDMKAQILDQMDLEREKGITIKLQPVQMEYQGYQLNLIDTPGHVDFSYEVSRSLNACEGALLVIDSTQGIQAQTLANLYLALGADLKIIPILNKIDLPAADVARVSNEIVKLLGCDPNEIIAVSAKTGQNIESVLEAVISKIPCPSGDSDKPTRALIFDSQYDEYRGVVLYTRIVDGKLPSNAEIKMVVNGNTGIALEVGVLKPKFNPKKELSTGEIGYIVTNLRSTSEARVGDTVTIKKVPATNALEGYQTVKPFVFAGIFPESSDDYPKLKDSLSKLSLNDSSLTHEPENSQVLGFGFRVGFLGLLHLEIVKERLEREYGVNVIITNPGTNYKVETTSGEIIEIQSAAELPEASLIQAIQEPWVKAEVLTPKKYLGAVLELIATIRGLQTGLEFIDESLTIIRFKSPLATLLTDFYDSLKSITSGYGSLNYDLFGYQQEDLVRLDFLLGGEKIDALSLVVHRSESVTKGRKICEKLKSIIPKQMFKVSIQAAIGAKIIAREDIAAFKKDVTAKLYGGDVSRKKKLWEKQKKGKERMKKFGKVDIPNETFAVLLQK
jgi:GTP-binding protein LepA